MSRTFEGLMTMLSEETGYDYNFLVDRYEEVMNGDGDFEYFLKVSREKGW